MRRVRVTIVAMENNEYYMCCVCVGILASLNRHAKCIFSVQHYIFLCSLSGCDILFHIISQTARFSGGGEKSY